MIRAAWSRLRPKPSMTNALIVLLLFAISGINPVHAQQSNQGATPQTPQKPVGQAPQKDDKLPDIAQIFPDQPGVLTPKGELTAEPSLQYANSTNNRVALVGFTIIPAITVGLINIQAVQRDTWTAGLTTRYGVTNRFELETRIPYVYRQDTTITRAVATPTVADSVFDTNGKGLGDVEFAARYQLNRGGEDSAYYVGTFRVKTRSGKSPFDVEIDPTTNLPRELPTGSGFWGLQPQMTWILPSDPAVLFGSVSYLYNIKRDVGKGFGTVSPGNAFGINFGMGLSLNEKFSLSVGYDHSSVAAPRQEGNFTNVIAAGSTVQVGTLLIGGSYRLSRLTTVNVSLGVGVTRNAPDLQLTLRIPLSRPR
jgi:hypothetical protein